MRLLQSKCWHKGSFQDADWVRKLKAFDTQYKSSRNQIDKD